MVFESFLLSLPTFLANVIPTFLVLRLRQGKGNSLGFLSQMIKTKPETLYGREGEEHRSKDTIILCLFFSLEEILAPEYSTVGRHLESGLAKGSVVIRSHKSDMKGRDHMVGEESDGAVLSAVTVQMCSLTQ